MLRIIFTGYPQNGKLSHLAFITHNLIKKYTKEIIRIGNVFIEDFFFQSSYWSMLWWSKSYRIPPKKGVEVELWANVKGEKIEYAKKLGITKFLGNKGQRRDLYDIKGLEIIVEKLKHSFPNDSIH